MKRHYAAYILAVLVLTVPSAYAAKLKDPARMNCKQLWKEVLSLADACKGPADLIDREICDPGKRNDQVVGWYEKRRCRN